MKKTLVNILLLFCIQLALSQEYLPFERVYSRVGTQKYVDALETDSCLILAGSEINNTSSSYIEIMRVDKLDGTVISSSIIGSAQQSWNPFQIFFDSDEKLWLVCENEFVDHNYTHIMRLGNKDAVEFDITLGTDSTYQRINYVAEVDGYFYMAGTFASPDMTFGNDFWVVKMKRNGTIIWDNHFGLDSTNEVASSLQVSGDKIYVFGDKNLPNFTYNPYLVAMDTAGNFISDTPLDWPYNCGVKTSCITDNNIYVTGESSTSTSTWFDIFLDKYDLQGNRLWRKLLPGTEKSETGFDIKLSNGNLFITGYAYNAVVDNTDMHCTIIDTAGNILDQRFYNVGNIDIGFQITPTNHGGFYIAGTGFNGVDSDYFLVFDTTHYLPILDAIPDVIVDEVKIFSNPGKHPILKFPNSHKFDNLMIVNSVGKNVYSKEVIAINELTLNFLEKGIYFVVINDKQRSIVKKIIIQ